MKLVHSPRRRQLGAILVSIAAALTAVATASAVPVRGTLQVPREHTPPGQADAPDSFYWEEWNGVLDPRPRRLDVPREIAVVLLGATEGERPDPTVKLEGGALMPATMVVQAGATLRIQNTDPCAHELYVDGIDGFAALQTAPGNARTVRLPAEPGHHVIRDRLYPHVVGHLHLVSDLAARATVGDDGRYVFDDVGDGNYALKAYYGDREVHSRQIEVGGGALNVDPISLDLSAASQ